MTYSPRRTPEQWQALVEQWHSSGLSAADFCKAEGVGYASFCKWRKRLADTPVSAADSDAPFIDLGALASANEGRGWKIVLSLGNGVELRLSQD